MIRTGTVGMSPASGRDSPRLSPRAPRASTAPGSSGRKPGRSLDVSSDVVSGVDKEDRGVPEALYYP